MIVPTALRPVPPAIRVGVRAMRRPRVTALVLIVAAAIAVDLLQWAAPFPFWLDEEMIAINLRDRGFAELHGPLWLGQSAPLGWLFLQRAIILVSDGNEHAMRAVPLLFGMATVVLAAWFGRRWLGQVAATTLISLTAAAQWFSHYRFEVKHYTADVFAALLVTTLAVWCLEGSGAWSEQRRRWLVWWTVAAIGQWFAYGALFVTPLTALAIVTVVVLRDGLRAAVAFSGGGLIWAASFAANYYLSLRHSYHSPYLWSYWGAQVPPSGGIGDTVAWLTNRFDALALNPGGTTLGAALWLAAGYGFLRRPKSMGLMLATVPLSAFLLAALRLVPLFERLSLWMVPALYVGVAVAIDHSVKDLAGAWRARKPTWAVLSVVPLAIAFAVAGNVAARGIRDLELSGDRNTKHRTDDRSAGRWLRLQRQPGDAIVATRNAWPALWWYAGVPFPRQDTSRLPDGSVMYEIAPVDPPCRDDMRSAFMNHPRILIYWGFPNPEGFDQKVLSDALQAGALVAHRQFSDLSRVAVIDRRLTPLAAEAAAMLPRSEPTHAFRGCVSVKATTRW